YHEVMLKKLGIVNWQADDEDLLHDLLELMKQSGADFTLTFRQLTDIAAGTAASDALSESFHPWLGRWQARLEAENEPLEQRAAFMRTVNPLYIPRNHLVEEAIEAAVNNNDFEPFHALMQVLSHPFEEHSGQERYTLPPQPEQVVRRTFCGT
ncbi:MAG: protein adenylyltransferase SelO family protein, partial [Pseudomonadales bacterium]